jgi:DNA mismatch repair protein MutL
VSRLPQKDAESTQETLLVRRLPDALVDQIAAGEVVERPASVVKELIENSVDAGAGRVRVEVHGGGAALIAVTDDGSGMSPGDARLALERHATSKLTCLDDLHRIHSFGFRGEALPAIASVSKLRLRTRERGRDEGFEMRVEGGVLVETRAAAGAEGTRIEVAELFGNVPARRKFLKSATTEWGHIGDWLARAALALPRVHFDVRRDGKSAFTWPSVENPLDRIAAVLSERDAAALVAAERDQTETALRAYVSRPDAHRATTAGIHLFVNGRPVRDRLMRHALLQVYRDVLPRGRFPIAVLFLRVPTWAVDVNVHPAKWEVRFDDPQAIHRLVTATVGDAISARGWLGDAEAPHRAAMPAEQPDRIRDTGTSDWIFAGQGGTFATAPRSDSQTEFPGEVASPAGRPFRFEDLRLLGQLLGTYLLLEEKRGLLLVDQHAAHERVLYERLRAAWLEGRVEGQGLLVPTTVEVDAAALTVLVEHGEVIHALGFEVEPFGERTLAIRAVPALLAERDPIGLIRGLVDELRSGAELGAVMRPGTRILEGADHLFASMACHSARRAGEVLHPKEQRALLESVDAIPWAPSCPHGRPVAVPITLSEIERRFGRS